MRSISVAHPTRGAHLGRPHHAEPPLGGQHRRHGVARLRAAGEGVLEAEGRVQRPPHRVAQLADCLIVVERIRSLQGTSAVLSVVV